MAQLKAAHIIRRYKLLEVSLPYIQTLLTTSATVHASISVGHMLIIRGMSMRE